MKKMKFYFLLLLATPFFASCGYNSMVEKSETVDASWAQVQNVYQRRADLIPNLVATVKGYAAHESETLQGVIEARAKATSITVNADQLTPEKLAEFQKAQQGLSGALGKLMMITENYPDLKANQGFLDLQAQLEGTENRITVERMKFNDATRDYNTYIQKFPKNLIAKMFDFVKKPYFEAEEGAKTAPKVQF